MFWKVLKRKTEKTNSSEGMSRDMNWVKGKNQDLTDQISKVSYRVKSWGSEHSTEHTVIY